MQTNIPLVSVVILNFNGLEYLRKIIPPILELNYSRLEVVVVDNKSTDRSVEYVEQFPRIQLVRNKENFGYSVGKNTGINESHGEYVLLLDNDILIHDKDIIAKLIIHCKGGVGLLQIPLLNDGEYKTKYYGLYLTRYGYDMNLKNLDINKVLNYKKDLFEIVSPTGGAMFFKKKDWLAVGGFDNSQEFNIDDVDIGPRFYLMGFRNYLFTKAYFTHLGFNNGSDSLVYAKRSRSMFSGHLRSFVKNLKLKNLILISLNFYIFQLIKAVRYSFKKKTPLVFLGFLYSNYFFLKMLPDTIVQRRKIQSTRVIDEDDYLDIKPDDLYKL